jgi:hypothetical protein
MLTSQLDELFADNGKQEFAYICIGFGAFFLACALNPIPFFGLWMSRKAILLANIMIISGSALLAGTPELRRFLLAAPRRAGTLLIAVGFVALWKDREARWTSLLFLLQLLGVASLFGPYAQGFMRVVRQLLFPMLLALPRRILGFG